MPTIVRHLENGREYVLLGTGLGMYKAMRPHAFFGHLSKHEEQGEFPCVALVDASGKIQWADSEDVVVVRVGDRAPEEWLRDGGAEAPDTRRP